MLIPRFSIRWLMVFTAVCAVIFLLARGAMQGQHWAAAIVIAVVFAVLTLLVHAAFFGLAWLASQVFSPRQKDSSARLARPAAPREEAAP